jgi:hypothetical protein
MTCNLLRKSALFFCAHLRELFILFLLTACHPAKLAATFQPTALQANDLEETLTRRDEIMLAYALSVYDAQNHLLDTRNGAWGVERVKTGQAFAADRFAPLTLPIPKGGRLVATLALMETEDYSKATELVGKIRQATGLAGGAATLLQATELSTPLGYLLLSLQAAGFGFELARRFDADDVLGTDTFTLTPDQLRTGPRRYTRPLRFRGRHLGQTYDYELTYDLRLGRLTMR